MDSMDIGSGTSQHLGTKTSKGLQKGQMSGIAHDPQYFRTLGIIPRLDLRHFVVEGVDILFSKVNKMFSPG